MPRRIAVVTDATSDQYCFPYWHRYYSSLFGAKNLFLLTYPGKAEAFERFELGGLIELPLGYEEEFRAAVIGRFVSALLPCYDLVVRVDTDEFLMVDPATAPTLADYLETMPEPYLTARGFDVIQIPGEIPLALDDDAKLLRDRAHAYPNTALNKTCVVGTSMEWSAGFHWATVSPRFGPVFMLHMKRIDLGWQAARLAQMTADLADDPRVGPDTRAYFAHDETKLATYHQEVAERPRLSGLQSWYRHRLQTSFMEAIRLDPATGQYRGQYGHELVLCEIPWDWKRAL